MSSNYYEHAKQVVERFKSTEGYEISAHLTGNIEDELVQLIAAAIASEVDVVVERLDELVREMRTKKSNPDLGL